MNEGSTSSFDCQGVTLFLQVGLRLLQAWEASAILQTMPLFSTVFAVLLLHESLTLLQIIGGCIILVGGFMVIQPPFPNGRRKNALPSLD